MVQSLTKNESFLPQATEQKVSLFKCIINDNGCCILNMGAVAPNILVFVLIG